MVSRVLGMSNWHNRAMPELQTQIVLNCATRYGAPMSEVQKFPDHKLHIMGWMVAILFGYRDIKPEPWPVTKGTWVQLSKLVPERDARGEGGCARCPGCKFVEWLKPQFPIEESDVSAWSLIEARFDVARFVPTRELCGSFVRAIDTAAYGAHTDLQVAIGQQEMELVIEQLAETARAGGGDARGPEGGAPGHGDGSAEPGSG